MNKARRFVAGLIAGFLLLGSAVVFAGNNAALSFIDARPLINVTLSGTVERDNNRLPLEKAESVNPGEILH